MTEIRTLEDVQRHNQKVASWRQWPNLHGEPVAPKPRPEYVPVRERKRGMNGLEKAFAASLEAKKAAGLIVWWAFEPIRIRLADSTFYKPDFLTVDIEGRTDVYETKGLMREAARVRLNVAADRLPWKFWLVRKCGTGFTVNPVFGRNVPRVPNGTGEGE